MAPTVQGHVPNYTGAAAVTPERAEVSKGVWVDFGIIQRRVRREIRAFDIDIAETRHEKARCLVVMI